MIEYLTIKSSEREESAAIVKQAISFCANLVQLANDLDNDRRWTQDVTGKWLYVVPDVRFMELNEECDALIAIIPTAAPDSIREYTQAAIVRVYLGE